MSSLPASMKRIRSKTVEKKSATQFFPFKSYGDFSDAKGQLTPQSVVEFRSEFRIPPSSHACHFHLQVRKGSDENSREKVATPFSHYNPMGAICCHGNQSSDLIWPKTYGSFFPAPMMLLVIFHCDRPVG